MEMLVSASDGCPDDGFRSYHQSDYNGTMGISFIQF